VLKIRKLVELPFDSVVVSGDCAEHCAEHCAVGLSDSDPPQPHQGPRRWRCRD
jgi:hypothetical protein